MIEQKVNHADKIEKRAIPAHLHCIEQEHEVKILLAVESGIYVHKPEWYFKVEEQRKLKYKQFIHQHLFNNRQLCG